MARPTKFIRNQEQANRVEQMAIIGCNDNHIASIEGMSETKMRKLYDHELKKGRAKGIGAVAKTLYQMALSGKNPAATFFYLKCRARWQEVQRVEHTDPDGKAIEQPKTIVYVTQWGKSAELPDEDADKDT